MSQTPESLPPIQLPRRTSAVTYFLRAAFAFAIGLLTLAFSFWNIRLAQMDPFLRDNVLASELITGIGAAICFGLTIRFFNAILRMPSTSPSVRIPWYWRLLLYTKIRGLMLLQLIAMALSIGAAAAILLHEPIPGPDRSILYPEWVPPESVTPQ